MLKIGPYHLHRDLFRLFWLLIVDNFRTVIFGVPKRKPKNLIAMAKEILKENVNKHLVFAGRGHFRLMWIFDFSVALKGLIHVLPKKQIGQILQYVIDVSYKHGYTQNVFTFRRSLDIPYPRGDSLPWLIYAVNQFVKLGGQRAFLKRNRAKLQQLLLSYQKHYLDKQGFVRLSATGDWADTIHRPSSTWNNLLALYTSKISQSLGLKSLINWRTYQKLLLKQRYQKGQFTDYAGSSIPSVDAPILALYLGLFNRSVRLKLANWLESKASVLTGTCPTRPSLSDYPKKIVPLIVQVLCPHYHSRAHWLHLGLMWANGLKNLNQDYQRLRDSVETVVKRYRNFVEVVDTKGNIFRQILSSEHGFTMTAGQYLELVTK